ncbi:tRNA pseudouridine(13) synthase TruD, partial [Vibrio parahaemolyticus]|nr:tRNA pseudouridine(13) synthase TruD [Vibrio parahaemolyticus]
DVEQRLEKVKQVGVPNYFGSQRFGNDGNNLEEARRWGRENVRTRNQNKRSMYLSAARSWIFNRIVSARLENCVFDKFIDGDIAQTNSGTQLIDANNIAALQVQFARGEAAITAALAGDNALPTQAEALALEQPFLDEEPDLMALIRGNRMRHDRRDIALKPKDLAWTVEGNNITLTFSLDAGSFATSIVRELVNEVEVERE